MTLRKDAYCLFSFVLCLLTIVVHASSDDKSVPNNQLNVGIQPFSFKLLCLKHQEFSYPVRYGRVTVHCLQNQTALDDLASSLSNQLLLTSNETQAIKSKFSFLLTRDSYASVCVLNCSSGRPSHRSNHLSSRVKEPISVNIGCDDAGNLTCERDIFNSQTEERTLRNVRFIPSSLSRLALNRLSGLINQYPDPDEKCGCGVPRGAVNCSDDKKPEYEIIKKVVRGFSTRSINWPWQVFISYNGSDCGGILIDPQYVLTAGHCLPSSSKNISSNSYVGLGFTNLIDLADTNVQVTKISEFKKHQNFSLAANGDYYHNDIALVKLQTSANVSGQAVRQICMPGELKPLASDECYVTGFGITANNSPSLWLQAARVPIIDYQSCKRFYSHGLDKEQNICAGAISNRVTADTCSGDSGGPLACKRSGSGCCDWYLAGMTQFGRSPCGVGVPSVYINISHYQPWIQSTLARMKRPKRRERNLHRARNIS